MVYLASFIIVGVALFVIALLVAGAILYVKDKKQVQHAVLRNYPLLGRIRYFSEKISPELRQYYFDPDDKQPFSREDFQSVAKSSKYINNVVSFGTSRDYEKGGYFLKNSLFPKRVEELRIDNSMPVQTKRYVIDKEGLFTRNEHMEDHVQGRYLLKEEDAVILGETTCREPFKVRSVFGMSGMSYGALSKSAIRALSLGLGNAGGTWMNTGEGGLTDYHLEGGVDIICQIGPAKFGFRNEDGSFSWEKAREVARIPQVKAFEIKLAQGAKIRGGKISGVKVTPEVAKIRGVEPWKDIESPNRFDEFSNDRELLEFIQRLREETGKPVGIKIVVGGKDSLDELLWQMRETGIYPDFISIDGGEGGTGSAPKAMMDSVGLPIRKAIVIVDDKLKEYGFRDRVKIIASGKMISADRIAVALSLGADLVQIARGFMMSLGCIGAMHCHNGKCPVGITTHDPELEKALVVDEKKYRVTNYVLSLRKDLFDLAAACGIDTPTKFSREHVVYITEDGKVQTFVDEV